MPHYKLNYFDARGFGEAARIIFHYAGQEFDDNRFTHEQWPEIKPKSETGKAPWLEVDDEKIYESTALTRYLGHTYGLAGKDVMENAQIDSIVDTYKDFLNDARPYLMVKAGRGEGNLDELKPKYEESCQRWYTYLQKRLDKTKSGFIASKLSWGDLFLAEGIKTAQNFDDQIEKKYPKIVEYKKRVHSQPKIKEYIEKRNDTIF
uniref:glutathione transferase n=1 Tax=Panagrolaimus superbus TaxID=310955 RepID=A0A914YGQ2_9BILA